MRRRGRIACPPPLGSPVFAPFSETGKRAPTSRHNPSDFEIVCQNDPKSAPRGLPKGAQNVTKIRLSGALGPFGTPRGHHGPKMTPQGTKMTSKRHQNDNKRTTNQQNCGRTVGRVTKKPMLLLRSATVEVRKSPCGHVTAQKYYF